MPLLKKRPFSMEEPPKDLKPSELVYQVRFTKEIFREYHEYLKRMNLYRQRCWTCKITGKGSLTFEEALVSEQCATEKIKKFPKELMAPVLRIIQFSMLPMKDLVAKITKELHERLLEGFHLFGKKDNGLHLCKILKIHKNDDGQTQYEIAWVDKDKKSVGIEVVSAETFMWKKLPFTREILKLFIRESTYRSVPWIIHAKLAHEHGIPVDPSEEEIQEVDIGRRKRTKFVKQKHNDTTNGRNFEKGHMVDEPIKYPIDDLLVEPNAGDPVFTERPSPLRDFTVPMDCVGDLLMVWDFCSKYSRPLHLWPFSLEDFANAICHKESNSNLIVECHAVLLRFLIKDNDEYFSTIKERRQKLKITLVTWTEFLCDFLEMIGIPELRAYTGTIKRGHYGLLEVHAKLSILRELMGQAMETDLFRDMLDEYIEKRQELGAIRREEAMEEGKRKRKDREHLKPDSEPNGVIDRHGTENGVVNGNHGLSPSLDEKRTEVVLSSRKLGLDNSKNTKHANAKPNKLTKKQKSNTAESAKNEEDPSEKDAAGKMTEKRRKEYYDREIEKLPIRTSPLGKDRVYNRYWWFRRDGRIFIENSDSLQWGYYSSKEELDALIGSLNPKGTRERALKKQLQNLYPRICVELQKRSKDIARETTTEEAAPTRRSTRVRAPPRQNPAKAFTRYENKWKQE